MEGAGFQQRQFATVPDQTAQTNLIAFIVNNEGVLAGNWYKFGNQTQMNDTMNKTRELGGIVYDLPVRD
jgi:hypothetical protein